MEKRIQPAHGDQIARDLQKQTKGRWVIWYGHHTGHFWATTRGAYWPGLIEAGDVPALIRHLAEVDALFGTGRPAIRSASGAWALA